MLAEVSTSTATVFVLNFLTVVTNVGPASIHNKTRIATHRRPNRNQTNFGRSANRASRRASHQEIARSTRPIKVTTPTERKPSSAKFVSVVSAIDLRFHRHWLDAQVATVRRPTGQHDFTEENAGERSQKHAFERMLWHFDLAHGADGAHVSV